ncbi:MAG: hypothetical protein ACRDYY_07090 [Acidimicrobiales bacterium]
MSQAPEPSCLTPALVLSLQRTAGNAAVTSFIASPGPPPAKPARRAAPALPVQRFPATALSAPVEWKKKTASVFRPGEGMSGGVYILTSNEQNPAIKKVVVKPVAGKTGLGLRETGEQLQFGDRALASLLGISTPTTKVVQGGSGEFGELADTIRPHQPPKPPPVEGEEPVDDTPKQFVVMSEVPSARSIGSFADKAATDKQARTDLFWTVFDPSFVGELARISVGDLLLGNIDRLVMATNLGNVMVSTQDGKRSVYAIDTTPYLYKARPSEILKQGGEAWRNMTSTKAVMDDPAAVIRDFFKYLIGRIKEAAPKDVKGAEPPWKLFDDTYQQRRERIEADFLFGWDNALLDVFSLAETKEGRKKMKALTSEYQGGEGESEISYATLKAQAGYLGGRALGMKSHEESAADPAAYVAYKQLQEVTAADLVPNDRFNPHAAGTLPAEARSADLPDIASLPSPKEGIENVVLKKGAAYDEAQLSKTGAAVNAAKAELAQLGTKRRGGFLGRGTTEKPRNRVLAGEFIANSYLVGAGAARLPAYMSKLAKFVELFDYVVGKLPPKRIAKIGPVASSVPAAKRALEESAGQFGASTPTIAASVRRIGEYGQRNALADLLDRIAKFAKDKIAAFGKGIDMKNSQATATFHRLMSRPK